MTNQENQNNSTVCSDAEKLDVLNVKDMRGGMWVKVKYEGNNSGQSFICGKQSDTNLMP